MFEDGAHQLADGSIYLPDGTVVFPDGSWVLGSEAKVLPTGEVILDDGTSIAPDGTVTLWSGIVIRPVPPGSIGLAPTTVPAVPPGPEASSVPTSAPAAHDPPDSDLGRGGPTVKRHPLDPVSLVLGLLVVVVAIAALSGRLGELLNEPAAVVPIAAGLAGLALIASVLRRPASDVRADEAETVWRDPDVR